MLRRLAFVMLMGAAAALVPNTAFAQDEGEQPAPPPPPPPPPAPAPAPVRRVTVATPPAGAAASDHEEVVGSLGFQISVGSPAAPAGAMGAVTSVTNVGIRYWFNDKIGLDAGFGVAFGHVGDVNGVGFGLNAGVPIAIGIYKHITTFFEPQIDFFFIKPNTDLDPQLLVFDVQGALGFEWQLGWVEASRVSLTLKLGAGLNVANDGTTTAIHFATGGGNSVEGLFSGTLALTFYL